MTERDAQLDRSIKFGALTLGDHRLSQITRRRPVARLVRLALLTGIMAINAHALAQPQPIPRPRELRQAPAIAPEPIKPSIPTMDQERQEPSQPPGEGSVEQPPRSRAEWRAIHRTCGEEWSSMLKAGQTGGLIWVDFFETCQKRH